MSTEHVGDTLTNRWAQLKQQQGAGEQRLSGASLTPSKTIEAIDPSSIIIRPNDPTWDELEKDLQDVTVLPKPYIWSTIKKLFSQGYGAELLTAAEIARETSRHANPSFMFSSMVGDKDGNWKGQTLQTVHNSWNVRRNMREVMDKLKLPAKSTKAILKLAWRLKDSIIRYLSIATEQGTGIRNAAGVFFALTGKPKPATS